VGGLMASLDPYHLSLVLASLWHIPAGAAGRQVFRSPSTTGSSILGRLGWQCS
jgi:hypothetical protein